MSYLKQFFVAPRTTGTIAPSSRFLCDALLENIDWDNCLSFAELGSGDGILTKKILEKMRPDAKLIAYEIREEFIKKLQLINDPRLSICDCSAESLDIQCDVIFSCLPLVMLPLKTSLTILRRSAEALQEKNGLFVQFQYSRIAEKLLSHYFEWNRKYVVFNLPPAFVYHCTIKNRMLA